MLVESGAADRFGFGEEELALACASHAGETGHIAGVVRMLASAGVGEADLQCGAHWPMHRASADELIRAGSRPSPLHHNCSGKHAGFLCAACHAGADPRTYTEMSHPVQRAVRAALEDMSGAAIPDEHIGIDGCSVPNFALPLAGLARAFARFVTGEGLSPARAAAVRRLRQACLAKPWYVAGTGQYGTQIMQHFGGRVFVKTGAEGAYVGALPERGIGIAVKCDDGAGRAAEAMLAAAIAHFVDEEGRAFLARWTRGSVRNWRGIAVGEIRATAALTG